MGTLPLSGAACAGGWAAVRNLCVQAVGGGLSGLAALISDESALEVCIHDDALYKSMPLPLPLPWPSNWPHPSLLVERFDTQHLEALGCWRTVIWPSWVWFNTVSDPWPHLIRPKWHTIIIIIITQLLTRHMSVIKRIAGAQKQPHDYDLNDSL